MLDDYPASPGVSEIAEFHDYARRGNNSALLEMISDTLVNEKGTLGYTALHWAAQCGHTETVKLLLQRGANVNATCDIGDSALHLAVDREFVPTVKALVEGGVDIEITNRNGIDAMQLAKSQEMRNAIKGINDSSFIVQHQEDSDSE